MTTTRISLTWPVFVLVGLGLAGVGAATTYVAGRWAAPAPGAAAISRPADLAPAPVAPVSLPTPREVTRLPDVAITIAPELAQRARLEVESVRAGVSADRVRVPGVVEPNGYRQVVVTSLVGGRVTRMLAALGDRVRRGQTLAEIYSPELAQAHTAYLSMQAELEAAHHKLQRTQRLVEIGAASRQELEQIQAEHTRHTADVQEARTRLVLLGVSEERINGLRSGSPTGTTISVAAPLSGVVTKRQANTGVVVEPATELLTVVDLSTVWVIGNVYERDLAHVRVGSLVSLTTTALPGRQWDGRISYIDPQVAPETRTLQVRIEAPNRDEQLRPGMYVDVAIAGTNTQHTALIVSRSTIQTVDDRQFVYLPDSGQRGRFIEREVRLGRGADGDVEVLEGLNAGDVVVTKGSFLLRAERERLGLRATGSQAPAGPVTPTPRTTAPATRHEIAVTGHGFSPDRVEVSRGAKVTLVFTRRTAQTCATEVVIPALKVRKALLLNTPVTIEYMADTAGELTFTCGMNMIRGALVVP
jgi:membrane fusion protein, heavy metal efflux system